MSLWIATIFLRMLRLIVCRMMEVKLCVSIHVKGTVLDENGTGFIGAGVVQKGTTNGTMTDANGNFEINVPQGAILQFTFISYVPQELPATQNMKVTLVPDTQTIEETIVIGYGV